MLPQYSIHALRTKDKRMQQSKWNQHASHSRSTFGENFPAQIDDAASDLGLVTTSTRLGRAWQSRHKPTDRNSTSYKSPSVSQPNQNGSHESSILQGEETTSGANLGASKKGGVVKWFDEEIQLLMDLYWQEKSWEDIFEVCSQALKCHNVGTRRLVAVGRANQVYENRLFQDILVVPFG